MLVLAVARRNSKTVIAKLATNEDSSGGGLPSQAPNTIIEAVWSHESTYIGTGFQFEIGNMKL